MFAEWQAYYRERHYPEDRADLRVAIAAFWVCRIVAAGLGVDVRKLGLTEGLKLSTFNSWNDTIRDLEEQRQHERLAPVEIESRIRLAQALSSRN